MTRFLSRSWCRWPSEHINFSRKEQKETEGTKNKTLYRYGLTYSIKLYRYYTVCVYVPSYLSVHKLHHITYHYCTCCGMGPHITQKKYFKFARTFSKFSSAPTDWLSLQVTEKGVAKYLRNTVEWGIQFWHSKQLNHLILGLDILSDLPLLPKFASNGRYCTVKT